MQPTKQEMIDKIYEVVKPTVFYNAISAEYVMIGDVLDWISKNKNIQEILTYHYDTNWLLQDIYLVWGFYRKPIQVQSYKCITFIYNLI